jgi:hypothetical protein
METGDGWGTGMRTGEVTTDFPDGTDEKAWTMPCCAWGIPLRMSKKPRKKAKECSA